MPKKTKSTAIPFVNNKGHTMRLSEKMTLRELLKIGVVKIDIAPEGTPLKDGWWRNAG